MAAGEGHCPRQLEPVLWRALNIRTGILNQTLQSLGRHSRERSMRLMVTCVTVVLCASRSFVKAHAFIPRYLSCNDQTQGSHMHVLLWPVLYLPGQVSGQSELNVGVLCHCSCLDIQQQRKVQEEPKAAEQHNNLMARAFDRQGCLEEVSSSELCPLITCITSVSFNQPMKEWH